MLLKEFTLQNFRCFKQFNVVIKHPILFIEGKNGSGKTSLLEALYYICYLKSFRTRITHELVADQTSEHFFIKVVTQLNNIPQEIQAGFSAHKRSIKINQKSINTYKEIINLYRVIALTEDDLLLIKGGPDKRRAFIDQCVLLHKPEQAALYKKYKKVTEQRAALFMQKKMWQEEYHSWTQQLWELSITIRQERIQLLMEIEKKMAVLLKNNFDEGEFSLHYLQRNPALPGEGYSDFVERNKEVIAQEMMTKKGNLGAHLDDIVINWCGKSAKYYASRGQQKLLVVLLKIAQICNILEQKGTKPLFLLDDFMTDFDNNKLAILVPLLVNLNTQLIFTCPVEHSYLRELLITHDVQVVIL